MSQPIQNLALLFPVALTAFRAAGQAPDGAWMYPSATGNLAYQFGGRCPRIADFSNCGYRGDTEPLPNVSALIPQSRWVYVSPGTGDDTALVQVAINAGGVVLRGAGDLSTAGTRLRATAARQHTLVSVNSSGSRSTAANTTRNFTQKLAPAGTRTFEVDSTPGLAVGHTVIVKRPSTANWIADIDMDQLGPAPVVSWSVGSKDLLFDLTTTRIDGNWITVDVPLPQTVESLYGGTQIWRYTWLISYLGGNGNDAALTLATPAQAWRMACFGTIANSGSAADILNTNSDGGLNLLGNATAHDPTAATHVTLTAIRTINTARTTYTRSKAILTGGAIFLVEWSDRHAAGTWSSAGFTEQIPTGNGTLQSVESTVPARPSLTTRFTRLKVTSP